MNKTNVVVISSVLALTACGIKQSYMDQATPIMSLNSDCMRYITNTEIAGFNHLSTVGLGAKVTISVATDGINTVCGYASTSPRDMGGASVTWAHVDQVSLGRCETLRKRWSIDNPCRIFSRNYDIVYMSQDTSDEK